MKTQLIMTTILVLSAALCGCGKEDGSGGGCIKLTELQTNTVAPAGVRTVFQASTCDGQPIADLVDSNISLKLDDQALKSEGDVAPILTQQIDFEMHTLLLLDMSDSIVSSGNLQPMLSAARNLVHSLISQGHNVAIYRFAGPAYFTLMQDFTGNETLLDATLDDLGESGGLGTTDLYGSIQKAIQILDAVEIDDTLGGSALVLFTDGTDEAMASTFDAAKTAVNNSDSLVYTVGLGGDINQEELLAFGKTGFEWAQNADKLADAFAAVTQQIQDHANSHYLLALCSPRVSGERSLTIKATRGGATGSLDVYYNATGFDIVGCDPELVAFPCGDKECGSVEGIPCGACNSMEFCTDDFVCEEACTPDIECGYAHGVDCGDCSTMGDDFTCENNQCVNVCQEAQCGFVMGVNCGECTFLGDTFACEEHTCVDACEDAECGTFLGIDCGECSSYGSEFGCDASGTCVNACEDAECGTVLGFNCGTCGAGFTCNTANECAPISLPGVNWINVPAGNHTLGCNSSFDSACDFDEQRHSVSLSSFWIMDTEVTADMYQTCVTAGVCSTTHLGSSAECTFGVSSKGTHPINCIDWDGMREFCQYLGGDLPTEAQWERTMRGDHDGIADTYWIYPWGGVPAPDCTLAVMTETIPGCGNNGTDSVGTKPTTSFGMKNMAGNVSEWTLDWYSGALGDCGIGTCSDPTGPATGTDKIIRGGSFISMFDSSFRTAKRDKHDPVDTSPVIGGRCVL